MILPNANSAIRHIPTDKEPLGRYEHFPYDVEWALSRVLKREIENNEQLFKVRKELVRRWDFNLREAFKAIDSEGFGFIDFDCLSTFLRENGYPLSEDDIMYILRRTDRDQDGKLSYSEFTETVFYNSIKIALDEVHRPSSVGRSIQKGSHTKAQSQVNFRPQTSSILNSRLQEDEEEKMRLIMRKEQLKREIDFLKSKYLSERDDFRTAQKSATRQVLN